jgi:hypothetical protein
MVRPSAFAAFRLITSSNLVSCCTGNSAGLAPLRILSTYGAVYRAKSAQISSLAGGGSGESSSRPDGAQKVIGRVLIERHQTTDLATKAQGS